MQERDHEIPERAVVAQRSNGNNLREDHLPGGNTQDVPRQKHTIKRNTPRRERWKFSIMVEQSEGGQYSQV